MSRRKVILGVLGVAVAAVLSIVAYYWVESKRYVSTDDARVASNVVAVMPEIPGKILEWRAKEGDMVRSGDVLGRQDLGSALTSGALNPQGLGAVAGVFAEKAMIKAPISGQIIQSTAVVGEMAMPGMTQAIIADTDGLYILHLLAAALAGRRRQLHQSHPGGAHQDRGDGPGGRAAHDRNERVH